jgi:D-tyrosyl-tRNA(Tyr) deacylase
MKALLQRVCEAKVLSATSGETFGSIDNGLLVLVCAEPDDGEQEVEFFARKIVNMRLFEDEQGKMNRSVIDIGGSVLVVSQFTLAADWRRGNRPGFSAAAKPELAEKLYGDLVAAMTALDVPVETGQFRTEMKIALTNDGPVTIWMDSNDR